MADDLSIIAGYELQDRDVSWTKSDLVAYAIGVGATKDGPHYIDEHDASFTALPTYPTIMTLASNSTDLHPFIVNGTLLKGMPANTISGNPVYLAKSTIEIVKHIPLVSGHGWKWKTRYTYALQVGPGIRIELKSKLISPDNVTYSKLYSTYFVNGVTTTGPRPGKITAVGPPKEIPIPLNRKADWIVEDTLVSVINIDFREKIRYSYLNADPLVMKAAYLNREFSDQTEPPKVAHPLCVFGIASRAVIKSVGKLNPLSLKFIGGRFHSYPLSGDQLQTKIWKMDVVASDPQKMTNTQVSFCTRNMATGKLIMDCGVAYLDI
ncbi:hypothetical protein CVT24_010976 [Panaeolus cyanescens]|uniref:Peroxisomal multifunctional enzyme type 2-like N-terminal domain-containing protein n=1 Tax=Panaeolus cyanescens TaxID=181874 RepID=A0A409YVL5_9AGAR|nr:hypothetical protein CVT24_010976 [Panaeolus cyanescens]